MSKQAIEKSGEGQENEMITVSSTLPPEKRNHQSGRFKKTYSVRDTVKDPRELRKPTVGGALLRERPIWENLPAEIKAAALPHMLEFIAREPIPSNKRINRAIRRTADIMGKRLEVRKSLAEIKELPELIRHAITEQMDSEITKQPSLSIGQILQETLELAIGALDKIKLERIPSDRATGKYCLIAHDILRDRATRGTANATPPPGSSVETDSDGNSDEDDDNDRPTMPETPYAIKNTGS